MTQCKAILENILDKTHAVRDDINLYVMKEADYNDILNLIFDHNRVTIGNVIWTETRAGVWSFTDDTIR